MWMPVEIWEAGDEVDKARSSRSRDVRGEKVLEVDVEVDVEAEAEDEDVEMEREGYGIRDAFERVWMSWEKIASVVQNKRQRTEVKELHNGHDNEHGGDL